MFRKILWVYLYATKFFFFGLKDLSSFLVQDFIDTAICSICHMLLIKHPLKCIPGGPDVSFLLYTIIFTFTIHVCLHNV